MKDIGQRKVGLLLKSKFSEEANKLSKKLGSIKEVKPVDAS
jgi:hypothetical protein